MKIVLRKSISINEKLTLPKSHEGRLRGISWSDAPGEKCIVDFAEGRFSIDKNLVDILYST
jgi:hypothetical protein